MSESVFIGVCEMKKILVLLFLFTAILFSVNKSGAMSYADAVNGKKPVAILIYADWADNVQEMQKTFTQMEQKHSDKYNFVLLNIASPDTKEYNKKFFIYPNLPYVVLFRDGGKFSRFLKKDCSTSNSCFEEKLNFFAN